MIAFNGQAKKWAEGECIKFCENFIGKLYNRCLHYFVYDYLIKITNLTSN